MSGRLHHVSLTCSDLNKSIEFYNSNGFFIEKKYEDNDCKITLMKGETGHIELFYFKKNTDLPHSQQQSDFLHKTGLTHIAFAVSNLNEVHIKFLEKGYTCSEINTARLGGFRYFFTQDPDGNFIEFIEETE